MAVGNNDSITTSDVIGWIKRSRSDGQVLWDRIRPLVIINACHSLELQPATLLSYVDAFVGTGNAAGLIGTEVKVPQRLAMDWAETFFDGLLKTDGHALSALAEARTRFLAEGSLFGLVYTPHCWGHLAFRSAATFQN